jgi:hypothetical protein
MTIYAKLQAARIELQKMKLRKSGKNSFAGYDYYELGDVLPAINELLGKHGLCTIVSFGSELATMIIVDADDPAQTITITSPMGSAALKGCHEVQNIGAVETYQRRYLYMVAFEITEHDALDATHGSQPSSQPKKTDRMGVLSVKMKAVLADLAEKADEAIIDGYRQEGIKAYKSGDPGRLIAVIDRISKHLSADESQATPAQAAAVFTDDIPEDLY